MIGGATIYVIGCDVGTQSTKAILLDRDGRVVARAASAYGTTYPHAGWAEQDSRLGPSACGGHP